MFVLGLSLLGGVVDLCSRVLARGSRLLCLWTSAQGAAAAAGSTGSRKRMPTERIILQVSAAALPQRHRHTEVVAGVVPFI